MIKIIKLSKDEKQLMKPHVKGFKNAKAGFIEASQNIRQTHDTMWELLFKLYPEVKKMGYIDAKESDGLGFDHEAYELTYFKKD